VLDTTTLYVGSSDELLTESYTTILDDGREARLAVPKVTTSGPTFFGPVSYRVLNLAGQIEFDGVIAVASGSTTVPLVDWIQNGTSTAIDDPLKALYSTVGNRR
jgi:hypothetical protein